MAWIVCYGIAIFVFALCVVLFFVFRAKKHKERIENLRKSNPSPVLPKENEEEKIVYDESAFEDFHLEEKEVPKTDKQLDETDEFDDGWEPVEPFYDDDHDEDDDKFDKEDFDFDDLIRELDDDEDDRGKKLERLKNGDFSVLDDISRNEAMDMMSQMPPELRRKVLRELINRANEDGEE